MKTLSENQIHFKIRGNKAASKTRLKQLMNKLKADFPMLGCFAERSWIKVNTINPRNQL